MLLVLRLWDQTGVSPWLQFLGLWVWMGITWLAFVGLQLAESKSRDFSASIIMWTKSLHTYILFLYIDIFHTLQVKALFPLHWGIKGCPAKNPWYFNGDQLPRSVISVQSLSCVWLFVTPWTAACQAFLSTTNSQNFLKLMFIELVMPSNQFCCPLLLLPSIFPSIRVFSNESLLHIR